MSSNALLGALPGVLCKSSRNCSGCIFVVGDRVSQVCDVVRQVAVAARLKSWKILSGFRVVDAPLYPGISYFRSAVCEQLTNVGFSVVIV